jgi:hypothetical protein
VFLTGDAGATDLDSVSVTLLSVHIMAARDRNEAQTMRWELDLALRLPLSEEGRRQSQNRNDFRPPEQGSYIYTEVEGVDPAVEFGVGASYLVRMTEEFELAIKPMVYLGYWSMSFDSGWNRFGADQTALTSDAKGFSISPQVQVTGGLKTLKGGITLGYRYMNLGYSGAGLDAGGAYGWDIGAVVTKDF